MMRCRRFSTRGPQPNAEGDLPFLPATHTAAGLKPTNGGQFDGRGNRLPRSANCAEVRGTRRSAPASSWRDASMRALVVLGTLVALASAVSAQVAVRDPDDSHAGSSLSAGGEVRQEYEWFANEEWGAEVPDHNGYWLQRYMLHVDARLSRRVRLYGELKSGIEAGRAGGPRSSDEDRLDLHQAFVDVSFGRMTVRVGRQELAFGSQRLVSFREGPNMRQSFDGGTVVVQRGRWRADGFGTRYVSTETGVFDDSSDTGRSLWGVYAVRSLAQDGTKGVDLYYLGYRRTAATFDQGRGRELRHSWGARSGRRRLPSTTTSKRSSRRAVSPTAPSVPGRLHQTPVTASRQRQGGRGSAFGPTSRVVIGIETTIASGLSIRCSPEEGTSGSLPPPARRTRWICIRC